MNQNSLLYWYPKIRELGIPVPHTTTILLADSEFENKIEEQIVMGWYPVFLRTDLAAGKHGWKDTCLVRDCFKLRMHIKNVIDANTSWENIGIQPEAIVIREFLELESTFTAFSGNMPINQERRYFINQGKVLCHHPYWPPDTFESGHSDRHPHDPDWRTKLAALNSESEQEVELLAFYSKLVAQVMPEYWSVDFAKTVGGTWYLIDMALGKNSFHWKDCPFRVADGD